MMKKNQEPSESRTNSDAKFLQPLDRRKDFARATDEAAPRSPLTCLVVQQ
jgi:hypothetical protein